MKRLLIAGIFSVLMFSHSHLEGQISPGPLAAVHKHLEGISNCTQCHTLGNKVTNNKCLSCHTELKSRIDQAKGYHSSSEARGKSCTGCHSDHHGVTFQIVKFDRGKFNHVLTGYPLNGAHAKKQCGDCHKAEFISAQAIRNKKLTYLGLTSGCTNCHADYHRKTITTPCVNCHGEDAWKPASRFSHDMSGYRLLGMHQNVACEKCHPVTVSGEGRFQKFRGIAFSQCSSCHNDPHKGQLGVNCNSCHTESSFHTLRGAGTFDHSRTKFPLEDRHQAVPCKSCHKDNVNKPLSHGHCFDCHSDYHQGQFTRQGLQEDCSSCHSVKGFSESFFTVDRHNVSVFPLKGAHLATPCSDCHKKTEKWDFRGAGVKCAGCHQDIHMGFIDRKYYPDTNCTVCHDASRWSKITFDHSLTAFSLAGPHSGLQCRNCHFAQDSSGNTVQQFSGMQAGCQVCHKDLHYRQFDVNGVSDCRRCHLADKWKIPDFDHDKTSFRLEGKHRNVPCAACHKKVSDGGLTYVLYKLKDTRCESCH